MFRRRISSLQRSLLRLPWRLRWLECPERRYCRKHLPWLGHMCCDRPWSGQTRLWRLGSSVALLMHLSRAWPGTGWILWYHSKNSSCMIWLCDRAGLNEPGTAGSATSLSGTMSRHGRYRFILSFFVGEQHGSFGENQGRGQAGFWAGCSGRLASFGPRASG